MTKRGSTGAERRPKIIDLFAGAGGLSLGFEQAGFDVAAAIELDPVHMAVHEYNFPETTSFCRDIRSLSGAEILSNSGISSDELYAVVGGAPCQGFSLIGKRALDDPRNQLIKEFARVVLEVSPKYFVLENVAGLASGNHQKFLDEVIELFAGSGYQVLLPYKVFQAAEYGVPQSRRRLFLVGAREGIPLPTYPAPTTKAGNIHGAAVLEGLPSSPTVFDALGDIPNVDYYEELLHSDSVHVEYGVPSEYAAQLRGLVPVKHFGHLRQNDLRLLTSSRRTQHTEPSVRRFEATLPGSTEPVSRFLRLHPQGISNTLRAGTSSDRGAHTSPRPIHPLYPRVITVREAARLHGYPDWFRFHVTKWHGFREIGNSVPPGLAQAIAGTLLEASGLVPQKGVLMTVNRDESLLQYSATQAEQHFGITQRVIPQRNRKIVGENSETK